MAPFGSCTAHRASHAGAARWGLKGPVLEIGVYRGKYLSVLYKLSEPDESVVGVDLFVDTGKPEEDSAIARGNVAAACGENARLRIVVGDSIELTTTRLREETGGGLRFVSIDGGHTRELVRRDLENAAPLLQPGGIMALDDAFNFGTPGVIEGITDFLRQAQPPLAPFAVCYNKLFVTTPDFHQRCVDATLGFLEQATWLPTRERTLEYRRGNKVSAFIPKMFGFEIVPFA